MKSFKLNRTHYIFCRTFCYFLLSVIWVDSISADENNAISFSSRAYCTTAVASWEPVEGASQYHLKYRPSSSDEPWEFLELSGLEKSYSAELWDGAQFDVQLEALDSQANPLAVSPVNSFTAGNFLQPPIFNKTTDGLTAQLTWHQVEGATSYILHYKGHGIEGSKRFDANTLLFNADLWDGAVFSVTMQAEGKDGQISDFSQTQIVLTGEQPDLSDTGFLSGNNSESLSFSGDLIIYPAIKTGPFVNSLNDCLNSDNEVESCTLERLPLIGQRFSTPTVENIMEHVMVSSDWMADRFRQVLQGLPVESLKLFKALTGIVIAGDIRVSHYRPTTGAMYIDLSTLWLDQAEIPLEGDPRSGCGDRLSYDFFFDYQINGEWLFSPSQARTLELVTLQTTWVLFHELVHANDFFPPDRLALLSNQMTVAEAVLLNFNHQISVNVANQFPLHSSNLKRTAETKYLCHGLTCPQLNLSPQTIADDFTEEAANSVYSFLNSYEDISSIGEEVMMSYFLDAKRLNLITDKITDDTVNYPVYWGSLGFNNDTNYRNKAKAIMSRLLPEIDFVTYIDNLPAADVIPPGKGLYEVLFPQEKASISKRKANFKHLKKLTELSYH